MVSVQIDGYTGFQHNRQLRHIHARSTSVGLYVMVKDSMFINYDINVVDKSYDGIIALSFIDKQSDYYILLIA